jgi:RNA polymerase sigma-70 factor (family 1)
MNVRKPPQPEFSITAFQAGHEQAFKYVHDLYYAGLRFFAKRLLQNIHSAEDVVQEIFAKLWEMRASFESLNRIKAFLYISTRNACYNFLKRLQIVLKNHRDWSYTWDEIDVDGTQVMVTRADLLNQLYITIEELPKECRRITRHSLIDGWSNQEIADRLGISIHTVKNQKARANYLLKKKLTNRPLLLLAILMIDMQNNPHDSQYTEADMAAIIHMLRQEAEAMAN